jgi:hypothetical protein
MMFSWGLFHTDHIAHTAKRNPPPKADGVTGAGFALAVGFARLTDRSLLGNIAMGLLIPEADPDVPGDSSFKYVFYKNEKYI